MNRWLETDTQKTARNIINVLNESAAGMVKKEINKDKPEEAPKNKKVALEKRITRAAIKGKKPESKNAKMPKKIAKKIVREVDNKIMNELEEIKVKKKVFTESTYLNENEKLYLGRKAEVKRDVEDTDLHKGDIVTIDSVEVDVDGWDSDYVNVTRESDGKEFSGVSSYELNLLIDEGCENEKIVKEERLASLKTQLEKDKDQLAADEIEAIEKEIADLEAELFEKEKLNETGEWDNNDDEMKIWKEELRDKAEYIANEIHGSVASVSGFDKYQGPVAIISTPIHGDVQLWFDNEDDTGLSLLCKIAHVGWIQGGANYISDILSREVIPEDEIINESEKLEENQIEDARKDSIEKGLLSEAVFEIDYADDDVDLSTEESVIEDVRNWLGTLANEVKIEVPELSGPAGGWPIVRLTGNKEKIAKFLLDNYNSGGEETLDDVYELYLLENKLQEDNLKLPSEEHPEETKKWLDPSQYSREEKKKVDFKGKLDSERKNNQGRYYPEYVPKSLKTGKGRGYAQADIDDMEAQNGISKNVKDYKAAVKNRDENRRRAERNRKDIPYYEKKVKDAQKDLEFQKNYADKLEKDADSMENKRKEILDKARAMAKKESMKEDIEFKVGDVVKVPYKYGSYTPGEFTEAPIIDISEGRYVTVEIPSKLEVTMDQLKKWNTLEESDNEPKTVKEYRIMDGNKVLKTFSADERSKGYAEMRAMGKALRDAGKEDNLIYKEFTVKNKLKEEYSEKRLNEEDTFEELIPEEDEDVEKMYDVISYYDDKLKGIEDSITSNDWSVITDFAHNKLMNGSYVKIVNTVSGKEKVITPSTYQDEFNGEFTIKPEGLTEAEDVQSELDDMKEQLQESDKNKLKEEYSEKFGGDPKDFIGDLISVKYQLSKLNLDGFGSHLARQMVEDFIDTCDRQIKKAKRLASGDEFYTEADNRTYKDRDEAEYYRNKELYANSNLARHREAMEKAKKACEEKGIKLDEDNYLSRTRKQEPLDLVAYEPEITSIDEVKDKYVKIRGDFHKVIDVKPEGDKFVISFAAGTGTAIGGEFEPATLDEIKRLQLYTENK